MSYQNFMTNLALSAGKIIRSNFTIGMKKTWKKDVSPLTQSDTEINRLVIETVKKTYPTHDILGEEESDMAHKSDYVWVCDPIDGTIPFAHGIPTCMFSLALTYQGKPIAGVLYDPLMNRMFLAEEGNRTTLNDEPIYVSKQRKLKAASVGIVWWKDAPFDTSGVMKLLENEYAITLNLCSINYMDALVACGEFVGTIFPGAAPHDSAAAKIVVEGAGGTFTDLFGNNERYDKPVKGHIASNGILHKDLLDIVKRSLS